VQIKKASNLSLVFKAVCKEQKLDCTGTDSVASYPVPPMVVEGSLREVVDNLLGGTNVNYRYTRPAAGIAAKLVLLGHAPQGTNNPLPASAAATAPERSVPMHSMRYPGGPPNPEANQPNNSPPANQPAPPPQTTNGPTAANYGEGPTNEQEADNLKIMERMFSGANNSAENMAQQFLPFPDQFGNPIPVRQTVPAFLPFPDQNGNPIPIKPGVAGSPFPTPQNHTGDN
jgi:hypothetical protein